LSAVIEIQGNSLGLGRRRRRQEEEEEEDITSIPK
jgi:hypothetical protein